MTYKRQGEVSVALLRMVDSASAFDNDKWREIFDTLRVSCSFHSGVLLTLDFHGVLIL